jgi:hypothetical protein
MTDEGTRSRLEWSVRALAQSPSVQLHLFPEFTECADELALEFDESYRAFVGERRDQLDDEQRRCLKAVDGALARMSDQNASDLWTDEGLRTSVEWARVRALARDALRALGLPADPPPPSSAIYVKAPT